MKLNRPYDAARLYHETIAYLEQQQDNAVAMLQFELAAYIRASRDELRKYREHYPQDFEDRPHGE